MSSEEATERELEIIQTEANILENDLTKKTERIKNLEKQNDRLLKEVRFLTEIKGNSERVHDLKAQNERLRNEVQLRNDAKVNMLQNVNKTIEILRKYLLRYQQLSRNKM